MFIGFTVGMICFVILIIICVVFILEDETSCKECKVELELYKTQDKYFLLPVRQDHTYKASVNYFKNNLIPIKTLEEVSTGQRICKMEIYGCPKCGKKKVKLHDFLYVRGDMVTQEEYFYDYVYFSDFIIT
jgi:hypothetical protein